MQLGTSFQPAATGQTPQPKTKGRAKRLPPFSLRLSGEERAQLVAEAAGAPLGAYIKAKVLGDSRHTRSRPIRQGRVGLVVEDKKLLGQVLGRLGQSRIASNLNQLAHLAHIGALPVTPEIEAELREAYHEVRDIRRLLLTALGFKSEAGP
ncbi:MAG: plasmid mobilization relaxosome protein MobC [Acetobacteraceae bacterium]